MWEIQSVIVLDCGGALGIQLLQKATHHDLQITAYAFDPRIIPLNIREQLHQVIQGDVLNQDTLEKAMEGHDAVFCAIESYNKISRRTAISQGCQNVIKAMKQNEIKKLVIASDAIALRESHGNVQRTRKKYGVKAEYIQMMDILKSEKASIDWVAMMLPKVISSQKVNPMYKVEKNSIPGEWSVTTGEAADFMVRVFMDRASIECFRHSSLGISSRPRKSFLARHLTYCNVLIYVLFFALAFLLYCDDIPPVLREYIDEVAKMAPTE